MEFAQQKRNFGDTNQIDPITIRGVRPLNATQPQLDFEFNSIDFSKPFPLNTLDTLTRELTEEMGNKGSQINKVTEALEYTSSKDVVSFSVSPLTTNLSDRKTKLTTIEARDFQTINSEEETSPKFNSNYGNGNNMSTYSTYNNNTSCCYPNPTVQDTNNISSYYNAGNNDNNNSSFYCENKLKSNNVSYFSNNGRYREIESFIDSSSCKKGKLNKTDIDITVNKKLSFDTEDESAFKPQQVLHRKKKEKQFSFAENSYNNMVLNEVKEEETQIKPEKEKMEREKEKDQSFHHVYENILQKLFNEKNSTNKKPTTNFSNKKNSKNTAGATLKTTEKKLNKREMTSYIEKIMTEAHRFKENKENSINAAIINFNTQNNTNPKDFRKKPNDINKKIQVQNTIIITSSKNSKETENIVHRGGKQSNVFQLELGDVPTLIPLKTSEAPKKSRRFSTFLY